MSISLAELAEKVGGSVVGDGARILAGVETLEKAGPDRISFFSNRKYKAQYLACKAGAIIVEPGDAAERPDGASLLVVERAYVAFAKIAALFHRPPVYAPGVDSRAAVEEGAFIDPTATVMPFCYIGRGVRIGPRTVVHAHCAILDNSVVGEDCLLYPGVVIREECTIGDRTIVQPGAVIGADGFGFAFDPEGPTGMRHLKVPQVGRVEIQPEVELGANTCVDRGTIGDTVVGFGSKLDNLVQIAHNVETGPLCLFAGQVGIAGSTTIGMGAVLGGQAGVIGHLAIGDGAKIAAKSGVFTDLEAGGNYGGVPAHDQKKWLREQAALHQLPDLLKELRALRRRVDEIEKKER